METTGPWLSSGQYLQLWELGAWDYFHSLYKPPKFHFQKVAYDNGFDAALSTEDHPG